MDVSRRPTRKRRRHLAAAQEPSPFAATTAKGARGQRRKRRGVRRTHRADVSTRRHQALQQHGSRLLAMLASVQQQMAGIQASEGPRVNMDTGQAQLPASLSLATESILSTDLTNLPLPRSGTWARAPLPSDIVAGHASKHQPAAASWDTPLLMAATRVARPQPLRQTLSRQHTPRQQADTAPRGAQSMPQLPRVRSRTMYEAGRTTTSTVVPLLRSSGAGEELVAAVTVPDMDRLYAKLRQERRHAPIFRPPPPKAPPKRRFARPGEVAQDDADAPKCAQLYPLPKIHGRPPTPPPETKTAEQLAIEKIAMSRASPNKAALPASFTVDFTRGTRTSPPPRTTPVNRRASDTLLPDRTHFVADSPNARRLSVRSAVPVLYTQPQPLAESPTADASPHLRHRSPHRRARTAHSPRRRPRSGRLRTMKQAHRAVGESSAREEGHDQVVATALQVGHRIVAGKVVKLQGSLSRANNAVQHNSDKVKDLLAATRAHIPRELLFSERMKGYRAEWASGIAFKVMGRILHGLTSSAWQRWKTFVHYQRWQEADTAVRNVQRVFRGFIGRQHFNEVLAVKRAKEAKERRRLARIARRRRKAATRIQAVVRGVAGRRRAHRQRELIKAATMIQRLYRAHRSRFLTFMLEQRRVHRNLMATDIQRVVRGHFGRNRASLFRKIRDADRLAAQLAAQKRQHEDRYRRQGAALLLTSWWKRQLTLRALRKAIADIRWSMAIKIQGAWRAFSAWRKFASRKRLWLEEVARMRAAAIRIQTQWRAHVARVKVSAMKKAKAKKERELKEKKRKAMEEKANGPKGGKAKLKFGLKAARVFFKDVNPFRISDEKAATRIQKVYRGFRTRKRLKRLRKAAAREAQKEKLKKRAQAMFLFKMTFRRLIKRRRARKAARHRGAVAMQSLWRGHVGRKEADAWIERVLAAKTIQRKWRNRFARKLMQQIRVRRRQHKAAALVIQRPAHVWLAVRKVRRVREQTRCEDEAKLVGRTRTERTLAHTMDVVLLRTVQFSVRYRGPVQRIFKYFATLKAVSKKRNEAPRLGGSNFAKMCRGCVKLIHKRTFTAQKVDLTFARHKEKKERTITYPQFVRALREVADIRYPKLDSFRGIPGTDGRFLRMFWAAIFPCRWAVRDVHVKDILRGLAMEELVKATVMMQRAYRRRNDRMNAENVREEQRSLIERLRQGHASLVIQRAWRRDMANKVMRDKLVGVLQKMYDPTSQAYYYFNTRTGRKTWNKPWMIGRHDIEEVIVLPSRDTEYFVMCVQCEHRPATTACMECGDVYCDIDFLQLHKKGKRAEHTTAPIPVRRPPPEPPGSVVPPSRPLTPGGVQICEECHYQAASRKCRECAERGQRHKLYCDVCYHNFHDKQPHDEPELITVQCCECGRFTAKWMCEQCEEEYCTSCFREWHKKGNMRYHTTIPLTYWTPEMRMAHRDAEVEVSTYDARMELEAIREAKKERHRLDMVIKIQAWWRGRKSGNAVKALLAMRRKKQARRQIQAKRDDETRKTWKYKLRKAAGVADALKSDVTYERDMRDVPALSRPPKGVLLPSLVTVVRGEKKVVCQKSIETHLVKGNRVRLGKWTFVVAEMKDKYKTVMLETAIPSDFKLKPPDQGVYIDPWGRKVEDDSDSDDDLRGEERKEMLKRPIPRLEMYRLPEQSHATKQMKKLGARGKWLLRKAGLLSDGSKKVVLKAPPKRYKDEFEKASAEERAELEKWELMSDDGTGEDRWQHQETGEITTVDPEIEFNKREMERVKKKELALDDVARENMRFQKAQMQKKIAEMKRKQRGGGGGKRVQLTAEQKQARLRRQKANKARGKKKR